MSESRDELFQRHQTLFQICVLCIPAFQFFAQLLVQPLNRRERDAIGIDGRDVFVVCANIECSVEILRHGTEVWRVECHDIPAPGAAAMLAVAAAGALVRRARRGGRAAVRS